MDANEKATQKYEKVNKELADMKARLDRLIQDMKASNKEDKAVLGIKGEKR